MKIKRLLFGLAMLVSVQSVSAQDGNAKPAQRPTRDPLTLTEEQVGEIKNSSVLQRLVVGYANAGDRQRQSWAMAELVEIFPNSGDCKLELAVLYASLGEKSKTYDLLMKMKAQGFGYDLTDDPRFAKVADTKVWTYVVDNLKANLTVFGEGKVAFELPKGDTLFESLGWDPKRKQFLVGSAREGKVYLADDKGRVRDFIAPNTNNGLWSVYGLAVDAERDLLYVASTASVFYTAFKQNDFGKAGIFKFQLSSGKFLDRHLLGGNGVHTLSTITVSTNGQVFAADGVRNIIYTIDGDKLKAIAADPSLPSIRGLAASDDGKLLYFADYQLGVFGVHLATGAGFAVDYNRESLVLGGIDGLYWHDGTLIAIENGMSPKRVIRLSLSPEGRSITKVMPIDVAHPAFALPTYGTIVGEDLYFIANSQKGLYGQYGELKTGASPQAVQVFRSNMRFAWGQAGITTNAVPVRQAPFEEGKKLIREEPTLGRPSPQPTPPKPAKKD
ncbi:MAG: hypothetical protein ABI650_07475 [Dokdonella sp.]